MSGLTTGNRRQYSDSSRLAARARLHRDFTVAETPWFEWLSPHLELKDGQHVLDVGCGPGWFWEAIAGSLAAKLDLTLLDQSKGMVEEAMGRCGRLRDWSVRGVEADAKALPFGDGTFDTVVAMHMLYHVPDPAAAIAEMHRALKPGGLLAVTTNGAGNLRELYALTTTFGGAPTEPVAATFGFDTAEHLMRKAFGNVTHAMHPASLRVTDPEVVFLALTSYPPGSEASSAQLDAFRNAIDAAFAKGHGVLAADKEMGLFLSRKAAV